MRACPLHFEQIEGSRHAVTARVFQERRVFAGKGHREVACGSHGRKREVVVVDRIAVLVELVVVQQHLAFQHGMALRPLDAGCVRIVEIGDRSLRQNRQTLYVNVDRLAVDPSSRW